jgi:hypothetical protein
MYKKRTKCASCNNSHLTQIHDFGEVPLAGNFPTESELSDVQTYQLSLVICEECKLVQTNSIISPEVLFSDYRYKSSIGLTNHFNDYTDWFVNKFGKHSYSILEIGCNDGVLLHPMQSAGFDIIGVDPAENIIRSATNAAANIFFSYISSIFL